MENHARKTTQKSIKFYDEQTFAGWALKYEYESVNGSKPAQINVNGNTSTGGQLYISKQQQNISVSFANGQMDAEVLGAVQAEFAEIEASFETLANH